MTDAARLRLVSAAIVMDLAGRILLKGEGPAGAMALHTALVDLDDPACEDLDPSILRGYADAILSHADTAKRCGADPGYITSLIERAVKFRLKLIARGAVA